MPRTLGRNGYPSYTPADDALLKAASHGDLPTLAERLGRTVSALRNRRALLRRGLTTEAQRPTANPHPSPSPRFARPSWFDEDLAALSTPHRPIGSLRR